MAAEGKQILITFHSHYDAARMKRNLSALGLGCQLVPVPRSISSSCGTALIVTGEAPLEECGGSHEAVYVMKEGRWSVLQAQ